jgi:tetratricopeptide (TPR) repeat protein
MRNRDFLFTAKNQPNMTRRLTFIEMSKLKRIAAISLLAWSASGNLGLQAQDKRTFTHMVDVRPGREDALLDIFKPISEQFDSEYRALGTAYTTGEILYREQRYDDAARNFMTVVSKGHKYGYLSDAARIRLAQSNLLKGDDDEALRIGREVANSSNKFLSAEAWYTIARAYLAKGKIDRAEDGYKNILTVNPVYGSLLKVDLLAGLISFEKGTYLDAASHFQRHGDNIPSLYYSIACFCQMKDIAKAVGAYQSLLAKAKKGIWVDRARILIGEAIYQSHDYDLAMTFFGPVSRRDAPLNLRVLALYRLACIDFQKKNYTRCELTLQNLLREYNSHPLRTDWMYLLATIPVYERDWNRTIKDEGKFNSSGHGVAPAPKSIPSEQLAPEAQFRVIWAYMALGSYHEVVKLTDRFFHKYQKNPLTAYALLLQGVAYDQISNMDKAIDSYQTLVDLFPQSPAAGKGVYLMTLSLHRANEPSRIVSALNHMNENLQRQEETKSDAWRKNTLFWIAEGYYSIQDYKHAEETYRRFVELAPDNALIPYALQGLAASLAMQGPDKLDQAKIYEQQAIQRGAELSNGSVGADAKLQLGKIMFNQKNFEGALGKFDEYVHDSTNTVRVAEALYNSGLALYKQQYYTESINRWKQVVDGYRFSPFRSQAYLKIGQTQFGLGKFDMAIAAYQALSANYPNSPEAQEAQYQIIQCYFNKGDLQGAYQQLTAFKNLYPADERIKQACEMLLSAYQSQAGSSNLHSAQLSDLLRCAPGNGTASAILWEKGAALFNKKDYSAAQKYFQRIMLSYPTEEFAAQAYYYNAECYFFLNNMDEAASAYKSFYINYPNDKMVPQAMFQVGVSYFTKKDYEKAAEAFDQFIKRFPQNPLAKDAALNVALCFKKAFRLDEAAKSYQNYLLLFPGDAKGTFVRLQIGQLHATKGDFAQAIKDFENIPGGTPERTEAQYYIGQAYQNLHKDGEAQEAFRRLLSMGPRDNEFRIAGLLELAKIVEGKGSTQGLSQIYSDIASSSKNQEIVLMAQQKLKELQGGQ